MAMAVKVIPHDGTEHAQLLDATLPAEGRNLLAVDLDGQFVQRLHGICTGFGKGKRGGLGVDQGSWETADGR